MDARFGSRDEVFTKQTKNANIECEREKCSNVMKNIITEDDRNVDSHKQKRAKHAQHNHCMDIKNLIEDTE